MQISGSSIKGQDFVNPDGSNQCHSTTGGLRDASCSPCLLAKTTVIKRLSKNYNSSDCGGEYDPEQLNASYLGSLRDFSTLFLRLSYTSWLKAVSTTNNFSLFNDVFERLAY